MNTPVTTRLNFKLMNEHDWPLLHELDQDPAVMKYINRGTPSTLKQIKEIGIPRMLAYKNANKGWGLWKITLKKEDSFIPKLTMSCSIELIKQFSKSESGLLLILLLII